MLKIIKISAITALVMTSSVSALDFKPVGPKAISMGGAGVASARSSLSSYYNPALLAKAKPTVEVSVGFGIGATDNGAGESVTKLNDSGLTEAIDRLNADPLSASQEDVDTLLNGRDIIVAMDDKGVLLEPSGFLGVQVGQFASGVFISTDGAGLAQVDQTKTQVIYGSNGTYVKVEDDGTLTPSTQSDYDNFSVASAVENGDTYLDVSALVLTEVPVSYGHLLETSVGDVSLGATLKFMRGLTYAGQSNIDSTDPLNDLEDSETTSSTFGIDLGVVYDPSMIKDLHLALVGKNLNSPSFGVYQSSDYKVDPMIRMGVAYDIFDSLEVAADYDITKNKTTFDGYDTQYFGAGVNFHPVTWFNIRGGLMDNTASSLAGTIYTAGIGLGPQWLQLDVAGQYASKSQTVDGTTYPTYSKINVALISRW